AEIVLTGTSGDGGGVIFRDNSEGGYRLHFTSSNKHYDLISPSPQSPINGTSSAIAGMGQINVVTIIARGKNIYIYINKALIIHIDNSTNTSAGVFDFFAVAFSQSTTILFRNVKIWA